MTGSEFKDYVIRKFKRSDKNSEIYEATTDIVADMRLQFYAEDYKEEAYSVAISTLGEYQVALPSDFGHIIGDVSLINTSTNTAYPVLEKISKAQYDRLYPHRLLSTTATQNIGIPRHYCIFAEQLYLGPVPDSINYRIQFNYTTEDFTEVTSATDPVPFTDKYRNVLRAGVLMELHNGMENYEEASYWKSEYNEGLAKIVANEYANTQDNTSVSFSDY